MISKWYQFLVLSCVFLLTAGLTSWPGNWSLRADANVSLISFTANSVPGLPEIYLEWVTGTEIDTAGFYIQRGDSAAGPFTRVSDFIPSEGDSVTGAQYSEVDADTELNAIYYYRLEVVNTNQTSDYYGPIRAVAGTPATEVPDVTNTPTSTPTPTPTRTPTLTFIPSATPTTHLNAASVNPTATSNIVSAATPLPITGETITPRPTSANSSLNPVIPTATPKLSLVATSSSQSAPNNTSVPSVPNAVNVATAVPPSPQILSAQDDLSAAPAPTLVPADANPAVVAPVVIATEDVSAASPVGNTNGDALVLVVAAILFLGLAFVILRQARP